jgi:hypothetical protein
MYYEIIYENGEHSIAQYDNDEEALSAINAHVERAMTGVPGTPQSSLRNDLTEMPANLNATWAAQRVVKVLKYDDHPADYSETANNLTADVAKKQLADLIDEVSVDGVVNMQELAVAVSTSTSPRVDSKPHESNYKMQETGELKGVKK